MRQSFTVDIKDKILLSIPEAAELFNIGEHKIRALTEKEDCQFVVFVGPGKRLIKRRQFERFLENAYSI